MCTVARCWDHVKYIIGMQRILIVDTKMHRFRLTVSAIESHGKAERRADRPTDTGLPTSEYYTWRTGARIRLHPGPDLKVRNRSLQFIDWMPTTLEFHEPSSSFVDATNVHLNFVDAAHVRVHSSDNDNAHVQHHRHTKPWVGTGIHKNEKHEQEKPTQAPKTNDIDGQGHRSSNSRTRQHWTFDEPPKKPKKKRRFAMKQSDMHMEEWIDFVDLPTDEEVYIPYVLYENFRYILLCLSI